jgi:hypothetical protein
MVQINACNSKRPRDTRSPLLLKIEGHGID